MSIMKITLAIDGSLNTAPIYKNKFKTLKSDLIDCLPIGKNVQSIDFQIIDINKFPGEAERLNIKSTPVLIVGKLKILGIGDLSTIVGLINSLQGKVD